MQNKLSAIGNLSKNKLLGKNKSNIEGYVESIDNLEVRGWVIQRDQQPVELTVSIAGISSSVTPVWHDRQDVAASFGDDFIHCGFAFVIPEERVNAYLSGSAIAVTANGVSLPNRSQRTEQALALLPAGFNFTQLLGINSRYGITATAQDFHNLLSGRPTLPLRIVVDDTGNATFYVALAKQKLASHHAAAALALLQIALIFAKSGETLELAGDASVEQNQYEAALGYYQDAIITAVGVSDRLPEKLERCKQQLSQLANTPYAEVEGYVERIDAQEIHGWAINRTGGPLTLSLRIADAVYPAAYARHERADIADSLGDDYLLSGFSLKIPRNAADAFAAAHRNGDAVEVLANNVALVNSSAPYDPATAKPANSKPRKHKKIIEGYIERIDGLDVSGWVINHDKDDIALALLIDGVVCEVTPVWQERADVAANFGSDFSRSGFTAMVPDAAVDSFLQACQQDDGDDAAAISSVAIDVLANHVSLRNKVRQVSPALNFLPANFNFADMIELNAQLGIFIDAKDLHKVLTGEASSPIRVSPNASVNASYYSELARRNLLKHNVNIARTLLKIALVFERRAEFLELLGNTYFEQKDYDAAAAHYHAAGDSDGVASKWLYSNLANCYKAMAHSKDAVAALVAGIRREPEINLSYDRLDAAIQEYWLKQQGVLEALAIINDRDALVAQTVEITDFIYQAYLCAYGAEQAPQWLGSCNVRRVLIVGDMHIPQCVRYRIDQKIEQLELAGADVTIISWTDLAKKKNTVAADTSADTSSDKDSDESAKEQNTLAFYDVIIFYRVPAEPQVLKAMAQANATCKLTVYEIDDLLFDARYPPPLETYGGYLNLNLYLQILKGMASFNAAARHCRFGIASTQPLAERLQTLVFGQRCYVHRNGIDAHNIFKQKPPATESAAIEIFYGSGTMAHNSDFNDLALPAIARILDEYDRVQLTIVGYLKLPAEFLQRYQRRVKQVPPVKNIKTYWSLLERADINLAVLHDDDINGCKSELKWFEAACLGIPSIVSTTANYRDVIRPGQDGLVAVTTEDWYRHLQALIDNPDLRRDMAAQALSRVKAEYSVEALSGNIVNLLNAALNAAQPAHRSQRKKIALVNVFFPPQSVGGGTRVVSDNFDLLQRDYADEFEFCVFTTDTEHKPPYEMTVYNHQGARIYRATVAWREHMDWQPSDDAMGQLFGEFLEAEQPDLIHFHCVQRLGGGVLEAAYEAGIPYIVTAHDAWWISDYQFLVDANNKVYPEGHPDRYQAYTPPGFTTLSESMERIIYLKDLLYKACDVLTVSETFADIYRNNEIPQIRVNKNGVSASINWQPKATGDTEKVVCGHVGGMAEHKGYFLLKKAITKLQPKNIELLIVDHSHDEGYRLEAHWGKVPVTFIGRMSQKRVAELYRQIDVLFAPSTWPESYGLVTREAAACGCWVVASRMGGIGEDVVEGQSGFVVEPTVHALMASLAKIDASPVLFKGLAKAPAIRSVTEQVTELADIYRQRTVTHER